MAPTNPDVVEGCLQKVGPSETYSLLGACDEYQGPSDIYFILDLQIF